MTKAPWALLKVTVIDTLVKVYNFTVEEAHNYYVGKNKVLVHNNNPCQLAKNWGRSVIESEEAVKTFDRLAPSTQKKVADAIEILRQGKAGGNQHPLARDLKGYNAIDVKGTGAGRGGLRVIYQEFMDAIYIHDIRDYHVK